jgi:heptosyltransferase-3
MVALPPAPRLLVISVARIGDTLLATPLMRGLKQAFPGCELTVLAHPRRTEVLQHLAFIDRLGSIEKRTAPWRGWFSRGRYDAAVVLGREPALVRYALRVSRHVSAYDEPGLPDDARLERVPVQEGVHAVLDRLRLVASWGMNITDRRLAYQVTEAEAAQTRSLLRQHLPNCSPLVGLQMSSFPTKAHRDWPVACFVELAKQLRAHHPEAGFVILGDERAAQQAGAFLAVHGAYTFVSAGSTKLRESAALMKALDLYVGVDTGPTHIAGALGIPMVALYHCLYPGRLLAPLDQPDCRVIEHPRTGTDCGEARMDEIAVATVLDPALELLATKPFVRSPA